VGIVWVGRRGRRMRAGLGDGEGADEGGIQNRSAFENMASESLAVGQLSCAISYGACRFRAAS